MKKIVIALVCLLVLFIGCRDRSHDDSKSKEETEDRRWKLVSSYPRSLNSFWEVTDGLTENVRILSGDKLKIRAYQPGELVPALGVFDAVSKGSIEMGITAGYYYLGKNKAFIFDTCEPFGLTASQKNAWLYEYGGLKLIQDLYKNYNIMYFPVGNTGAANGRLV